MSSDSQSIDKLGIKVSDGESCVDNQDKISECKVEIHREGHGKIVEDNDDADRLDGVEGNNHISESTEKIKKKRERDSKKLDRSERSGQVNLSRRRSKEKIHHKGELSRKLCHSRGSTIARKVFLLPVSTSSSGSIRSRGRNKDVSQIKRASHHEHSHSNNFHGGSRVILITTPLSCCCCCQRRKR